MPWDDQPEAGSATHGHASRTNNMHPRSMQAQRTRKAAMRDALMCAWLHRGPLPQITLSIIITCPGTHKVHRERIPNGAEPQMAGHDVDLAEAGLALAGAAATDDCEALEHLLCTSSHEPAVLLMHEDALGFNALSIAAASGHGRAVRTLLDHPSADPAAMMMHTGFDGWTVLMCSAHAGDVDTMRLLLDHPSADAAAMMMHACGDHRSGQTALMMSAEVGDLKVMRLLLDHPSADAAAMVAVRGPADVSTLALAAGFAAGQPCWPDCTPGAPPRSCVPLLLLLRRVPLDAQPSDAHQAHMTEVTGELCKGPCSGEMFDVDQPDDARDEVVRLLLMHGAGGFDARSPVVRRIVMTRIIMRGMPQLLKKAVLGVASVQQQP
jgi:ankyrin repeat protein